MAHQVIQGNVFQRLPELAKGSVDVVVTSPPYWRLRSYLAADHPDKHLELGSEPTPGAFVDSLVRVFRLVREAMADHAVCFVNIGDTYSSKPPGNKTVGVSAASTLHGVNSDAYRETLSQSVQCKQDTTAAVPEGNLCLIPWRLALALRADGWLVRSVIAWTKPSAMPASLSGWRWARHRVKVGGRSETRDPRGGFRQGNATTPRDGSAHRVAEWADCPGCDRCRPNDGLVLRKGSWRCTSSWEPILMLAKSAEYFADGDAVKTPCPTPGRKAAFSKQDGFGRAGAMGREPSGNEVPGAKWKYGTGANLRDVWRTDLDDLTREELVGLVRQLQGADMPDRLSVAAEPLHESHYAAFPSALVRKCLLAGTSARGYCPACSSPWCRVVETERWNEREERHGMAKGDVAYPGRENHPQRIHNTNGQTSGMDTKTLGWRPSCRCTPVREPRPAVVLDPFAGAGRTGVAARQLGLDFIGVELNAESVAIARRQIDNALRETKRQKPKPGAGLFDGLAAPGPAAGGVDP